MKSMNVIGKVCNTALAVIEFILGNMSSVFIPILSVAARVSVFVSLSFVNNGNARS